MILAVALAALILLFIIVRHNVGVPFLAMIAGVAVYSTWGEQFSNTFTFDNLAYEISGFLNNIRGVATIVGISAAYVDVFLFHSGKTW